MAFILLVAFLPSPMFAAPLYQDIMESFTVGLKGGSFIMEDPVSGVSVGINVPEGALTETTEITLIIHGTKQPSALANSHINGITIRPEAFSSMKK